MNNFNQVRTRNSNLFKELFKKNESMDTFIQCRKYARDDDTNILITGETGTGKEIHARYIHHISSRSDKPFIAVNFSSFNESTVYSSLFGHKKGSFTDASADQIGLFKAADGGTIFLDEIGDASNNVQNAMLRVLDYGEILPLGENIPQNVDVRVVSASNANFKEIIADKSFREDLYYRLSGVEIHLPTLRSKTSSELKNILKDMIAESAQRTGMSKVELTENAWNLLLTYEFRGNYREANNIVKRIYTLEKDMITEGDLRDIIKPHTIISTAAVPESCSSVKPSSESGVSRSLNERISEYVFESVARHNGVKKNACEELGISFKTLNKYLKQHSLMGINPISNSNKD